MENDAEKPVTLLGKWRADRKLSVEEAANLLNVTGPMWSRWENARRDLPAARVLDVERVTGISRHELRPDVFGERADKAAASSVEGHTA